MDVCVDATTLRTKITSGTKTNALIKPLKHFKFNFDLLYTITCDNKELIKNDTVLIEKIKKWMTYKKKHPSEQLIEHGLDLFYEYKLKLISYKIINVGVS